MSAVLSSANRRWPNAGFRWSRQDGFDILGTAQAVLDVREIGGLEEGIERRAVVVGDRGFVVS